MEPLRISRKHRTPEHPRGARLDRREPAGGRVMNAIEPLKARDVLALAEVLKHMQATGKIRLLTDNGDILEGRLRHLTGAEIGDRVPVDVREANVRLTTTGGMEVVVPIAELVSKHLQGACALDAS